MTTEEWDFLSTEDLLEVAAGVLGEALVRDAGALAAAAARPRTTVLGADAYPRFEDRAAALLHSLVRGHALVDQNKPLAWAATRVFHLVNGRDLDYEIDEAERLMVAAAAGELGVSDIAAWLAEHVTDTG